MLTNSLKRLNRTNRLITVDDISDSVLAGRSPAHTACWKYLQMSSYDAALERAEQIIKREPEKPDGYVFKARALFQKGRYQEAEEVLIEVMKIAEENDLLRSDVEGVVKLKDELANSRVEILRSRNFREPMEIAEMHWNDCHTPIIELIGFGNSSRDTSRRGGRSGDRSGGGDLSAPMEVDHSIIDIIGAEKAKSLYPELFINSSANKSINLNLSGEFPINNSRSSNREPELRQNTSVRSEMMSDFELRTSGLKTALLLAEEKNEKSERTIKNLEEELRKVYERVLKLNNENRVLEKKCNTLGSQLDKVVAKGSSSVQTRREVDPEVQILREVAANKRKRALVTLRNTWRPNTTGLRRTTGFRQTPKQNLGQNNPSPRQRPMVFTNSNRRIQDLIREESRQQQSKQSANGSYRTPNSSYLSTSMQSTRSAPSLGVRFRDIYGDTNLYQTPTQQHLRGRQTLEFQSAVSNAERRYPPGILPAPSFLGQMTRDRPQYHSERYIQY